MVETVTNFLRDYISPELVVFVISMLPILELRGGLIAASLLGIPWQTAAIICIIGNVLPIPFILFFIKKIFAWLKTTKALGSLIHKLEKRGLEKGEEMVRRHPARVLFGLYVFVAIPLPGTGGWTGALVASLLNMRIKHSFWTILAGVATAAVIMLLLAYFLPSLFSLG